MADLLFHPPGLVYFWFLNDECADGTLEAMLEAFAAGGVSAVIPHPRCGLLRPYGGADWFRMIRGVCERCAERGLQVWLYDEDPFPSGGAGGRLTAEHPELAARAIERHVFAPVADGDGLFRFPLGSLLWCGWVREADGATRDLTAEVGVLRENWKLLEPWDSRFYYPATPLYSCPRSETYNPSFALRVAEQPAGYQLQAFVARPCGGASVWGALPDLLNPRTAALFLESTHERYRVEVGRLFGPQLPAIFTDEPKCFGGLPWTPGLAEDFQRRYGCGLQFWHLFSDSAAPEAMLTRLRYREWCGERFRQSWLEPVSAWCRARGLALVGHISPEDDPVEQVSCVGNLFPLFRHFDLPGLDLIIPAVGDRRHPLLNLGVLAAVSAAQQQGKAGVLSESLGCSGPDATPEQAARILRWQLLMGVTTPVVHGAFNSLAGLRRKDAPPDWGPRSPRWEAMLALGHELAALQPAVRGSVQVAPTAILWPIRSFAALPKQDFTAPNELRDELAELVRLCLDRQAGVHLLDEAALWTAAPAAGALRVGRACYRCVLVPSCLVLHHRTLVSLNAAAGRRVDVILAGRPPAWEQYDDGLRPLQDGWARALAPAAAADALPRLADAGADGTDLRCTAWERDGRRSYLLMNLGDGPREIQVAGRRLALAPGRLELVAAAGPP